MDSKTVAVVAVVALVVGILAGYFVWGAQARTLADELAQVQARISQARQAAVQEGTVATKIQELEGQVKQATEDLGKEKALREKLEKLAAAKKK